MPRTALRTLGLALVLSAAGCVDVPALEQEEQGVGSGSGSGDVCRIVALSPTTCTTTGGRCLEAPPVQIPKWRTTYDPDLTRFGEKCGSHRGEDVRCGWGEYCQVDGDPLGTARSPDDALTAINHGVWCTPDEDLRWNQVARHANGAITSPPRAPTDPTNSIPLSTRTYGDSGPGAPRTQHVARTPVTTGWGPTAPAALACAAPVVPYHATTNPDQRIKELGSWRAPSCTTADGSGPGCNPSADDGSGNDRVWFVFADGVNSLEWAPGWATSGPDAFIRPGLRPSAVRWFESNGFRNVERAVYLNNHGIFFFDSDPRTTDNAGAGAIPDQTAAAGFRQILLDARACDVDYLSVVTHSNGVYTVHVGLTSTALELQSDESTQDLTIAVHHMQAAVMKLFGWPNLIAYGAMGGGSVFNSGVNVHFELNWWWTSKDMATWQTATITYITDKIFDKVGASVMKDHFKFGHNATADYLAMAYPPTLRRQPEAWRMRSMETDNCLVQNDLLKELGLCVLSTVYLGPFHDAVDMLDYVADHGTDDYRICTFGSNPFDQDDCYGFPWETNAEATTGTQWPASSTGWRSKYFPGAVRGGDFCAHPSYFNTVGRCAQ